MARADLILSLVKAGASGDQTLFRRATEALIAEERGKRHVVLAERLDAELRKSPPPGGPGSRLATTQAHGGGPVARQLLHEEAPSVGLDRLFLPEQVRVAARELIEEQQRGDLLRTYNLEPRHRVLLSGPPGNGKTSLARALATELMVPLLTVRYDALVGSYLGETASRLRQVFEFARTRGCVLFFDEFDTLGKERGDANDTGEIKRVVSSLLLQIDDLPSHVVVVTATNHAELLDRAVWRRFELRLELPPPTRAQTARFIGLLRDRLDLDLGLAPRTLAEKLGAASLAEIEQFVLDLVRRRVLAGPDVNARSLIDSRIKQWQIRVRQNAPRKPRRRKK